MAKFTVSRKTWWRGKGTDESALLRQDGMRCCLGFVAQQCGLADADILSRDCPGNVPEKNGREKFPAWFFVRPNQNWQSNSISDAMKVNDREDFSDFAREAELIRIFAKHGDTLEFVD